MKRFATSVAAFTMLSGCMAPMETGGAGMTQAGEPLSARGTDVPAERLTKISISSPKGWTCEGKWYWGPIAQPQRSTGNFPLKCNNGTTGNAIYSMNQLQGQATISFALKNGTQGQVTFGRT